MNLKTLFGRARTRRTSTPDLDWTSRLSSRDWADLPVHHPREDEGALPS